MDMGAREHLVTVVVLTGMHGLLIDELAHLLREHRVMDAVLVVLHGMNEKAFSCGQKIGKTVQKGLYPGHGREPMGRGHGCEIKGDASAYDRNARGIHGGRDEVSGFGLETGR